VSPVRIEVASYAPGGSALRFAVMADSGLSSHEALIEVEGGIYRPRVDQLQGTWSSPGDQRFLEIDFTTEGTVVFRAGDAEPLTVLATIPIGAVDRGIVSIELQNSLTVSGFTSAAIEALAPGTAGGFCPSSTLLDHFDAVPLEPAFQAVSRFNNIGVCVATESEGALVVNLLSIDSSNGVCGVESRFAYAMDAIEANVDTTTLGSNAQLIFGWRPVRAGLPLVWGLELTPAGNGSFTTRCIAGAASTDMGDLTATGLRVEVTQSGILCTVTSDDGSLASVPIATPDAAGPGWVSIGLTPMAIGAQSELLVLDVNAP
jgi:hypothetical protein